MLRCYETIRIKKHILYHISENIFNAVILRLTRCVCVWKNRGEPGEVFKSPKNEKERKFIPTGKDTFMKSILRGFLRSRKLDSCDRKTVGSDCWYGQAAWIKSCISCIKLYIDIHSHSRNQKTKDCPPAAFCAVDNCLRSLGRLWSAALSTESITLDRRG